MQTHSHSDISKEAPGSAFEYVDFTALDLPAQAIAALEPRLARRFRAVPVRLEGERLIVAMPGVPSVQDFDLLRDLAGRPLGLALAPEEDIEAALQKHYGRDGDSIASMVEGLDEGSFLILRDEEGATDISALASIANEAPIVRLVNLLISRAAAARATDIHLEPFEDEVKVRYRVDGFLHEVEAPPKRLYPAVLSRIKLMAGLDITERRLPQDGRVRLRVEGRDLDLRAAVAPTLHGESVALRILNRGSLLLPLETLGLSEETRARFVRLIEKPHGIILVTGPTGSGKTTTLYAVLSRLNDASRKIVTIEDPVEYELKGVNQMQVNPKIGFGFARGVRTIVRHDPDIILVGEIRDRETAEVAVQSALTGHLVFSTLHTNDAAGAFTRLLDMGIEEFLAASTVSGVLAQRLVRRVCPSCGTTRCITTEERSALGADLHGDQLVRSGNGCPECNGTGYYGQIGLFELLLTTPGIESLVMSRAGSTALREEALRQGMTTLRQDGVVKIMEGTTSVKEVLRVTQA